MNIVSSIKKKKEYLKEKAKKNPNFGMQSFLCVLFAGYAFFFTSTFWMQDTGELAAATAYYTKVNCEDNALYLTQFAYSEKDQAMQVIVEIENKDVKDKKLEYSAVERKKKSLGNLEVKVLQENSSYSILRITDVKPNWREISFRVQEKGKDIQAKFYTNKNVIERVKSLPKMTDIQCQVLRSQKQIEYDDWQIAEKEKQVNTLQKENKEIEQRIISLEESTYPTDEEAQKARDLVNKAQGKQRVNEETIEDRMHEIEELKVRSENILQQIDELQEQEVKE